MKRRLRPLLVFLMLGAIINVAVTLSAAIMAEKASFSASRHTVLYPDSLDSQALWQRHATDIWPEAPLEQTMLIGVFTSQQILRSRGIGDIDYSPDAPDSELRKVFRGMGFFWVSQTSSGFPMRMLQHEEWNGRPQFKFAPNTGDDGLKLGRHTIPRTIIWPAFASNTLFYAGILWLLFAASFAMRRRWRIKRGLCPACAYPIRGGSSDVCTECGVAIPSPLRGRAREGGVANSSAMHERS